MLTTIRLMKISGQSLPVFIRMNFLLTAYKARDGCKHLLNKKHHVASSESIGNERIPDTKSPQVFTGQEYTKLGFFERCSNIAP